MLFTAKLYSFLLQPDLRRLSVMKSNNDGGGVGINVQSSLGKINFSYKNDVNFSVSHSVSEFQLESVASEK